MKQSIITRLAVSALMVSTLSSCHIYKKFNMPADDELQAEYVEAKQAQLDNDNLGNLPWQQVFTDPMLADLINRALEVLSLIHN